MSTISSCKDIRIRKLFSLILLQIFGFNVWIQYPITVKIVSTYTTPMNQASKLFWYENWKSSNDNKKIREIFNVIGKSNGLRKDQE